MRPTLPERLSAVELKKLPEDERLERVVAALNKTAEETTTAVAGKLTVLGNMVAVARTLRVTVPAVTWLSPTLENSWAAVANRDTPGYRIDEFGRVHLRGIVSGGAATTVLTLPSGYRPLEQLQFATDVNGSHAQLQVRTSGAVIISAGTTQASLRCSFEATAAAAPPAFVGSGWPIALESGFAQPVRHVELWQAQDVSDSSATAHGALGLTWAPSDKGVSVRRVSGLTPGRSYNITFVLFGG